MWDASWWPLAVAALGVAVEIGGFGLLAFELIQTNRRAIEQTRRFVAANRNEGAMQALTVSEDDHLGGKGRIIVEGGFFGALSDELPVQEAAHVASRRIIIIGAVMTGGGAIMQFVGALGQAMNW